MLPRILRVGAEVSATMLLAELVADMSYERRAEVSYEDEAQFVTNVTEYNSIKSAIHDGLVNHIRRDVLGSDNKKAMRISTSSIEELIKDILPEDFESPAQLYEDKSVWFEIMRDLHDQKNLRKMHNDQRCFSPEEIRQMASFSSSASSSASSSSTKGPKESGELLEQILSAYTIEQGRQLQLRQQVDHNFMLCEQEMNRQLDIQDAEEYPAHYRMGIMVGLGVIGRLFFMGTDRLLGGPAVNLFAHKLLPIELPRQQIFRRFGGVTLMILFASYMRNYLRDHREEFNEEEKTAEEEFDGFLSPIFGKLWGGGGDGGTGGNTNNITDEQPSYNDPDTSIVTIQKIVDLKRNDRQVWAGETPMDPMTLSKRIYYQAALPLFQLFAFNHLLLRSLMMYLPGPIAHAITAVSFATHYAYVVTPFHHDQSLYEQGYRGMLRTMVVQTWSHLLQYPSRSFWLLFPLFGSSETSVEEMVLPEPSSYMIEGTERYQSLVLALQMIMAAMSGVGEIAHPLQPTTIVVPKVSMTTAASSLPEEVADEVIQVFSSDHFTTETRSKRLYQRDAIDLWLMWERYLRSKQATNENQKNDDSFVAQETPYARSPSLFSRLLELTVKLVFPEIAIHLEKESTGKTTPVTGDATSDASQIPTPVSDVLPGVTTYRPVIDTILTSLQVRVIEGVFHQRQKEMSTDAFLSFAAFLTSPLYLKSSGSVDMKEFLTYAKDHRRTQRDFTEDEMLDIVQASTSTIWRADELFLRYYEPFLFQKVEQMAAGRVRDPALANGARDVQQYLNILKTRVHKQLQWQYGMTDETLLFIFKTHSEKYPSTKTLLEEWKQFYSTSEFGTQRMKNIVGLDKSLMKQRLYLRAMNKAALREKEAQDKKSNAEK